MKELTQEQIGKIGLRRPHGGREVIGVTPKERDALCDMSSNLNKLREEYDRAVGMALDESKESARQRDFERKRAEEAEREVEKFRAMVKHLKYERDRVRQAWDRAEAEIENWRGCYETNQSQIRSLEDKVQELERILEAEQVNSDLLSMKLKKSENKE